MRGSLFGFGVIAATFIAGCGQRPLEPRDPDPGMFDFKVATFNIRDDMSTDPRTVDAIGQLDAQIVAIQEVTPELEVILRDRYKSKWPYMIFHSSDAAGIGFMSVWPVVEEEFMELSNGWHPSLAASVHTPAGWLDMLEVHLHAPEGKFVKALKSMADTPEDHQNEITRFMGLCKSRPKIVLGDFNEDGSGRAVSWLENDGYVNALPLYHPGQFTWKGNSVGGQFEQALDHVLFSSDTMVPLNAWIGPNGVSDHIPVSVHLEAKAWGS